MGKRTRRLSWMCCSVSTRFSKRSDKMLKEGREPRGRGNTERLQRAVERWNAVCKQGGSAGTGSAGRKQMQTKKEKKADFAASSNEETTTTPLAAVIWYLVFVSLYNNFPFPLQRAWIEITFPAAVPNQRWKVSIFHSARRLFLLSGCFLQAVPSPSGRTPPPRRSGHHHQRHSVVTFDTG